MSIFYKTIEKRALYTRENCPSLTIVMKTNKVYYNKSVNITHALIGITHQQLGALVQNP